MPSTLLGGGAERGATGEAVDLCRLLPTLSPAYGCRKTPPTGAPARSRVAGPRRAPSATSATSATIVDHTHRAECPQRGFRGRRRPRGGSASERAALAHAHAEGLPLRFPSRHVALPPTRPAGREARGRVPLHQGAPQAAQAAGVPPSWPDSVVAPQTVTGSWSRPPAARALAEPGYASALSWRAAQRSLVLTALTINRWHRGGRPGDFGGQTQDPPFYINRGGLNDTTSSTTTPTRDGREAVKRLLDWSCISPDL